MELSNSVAIARSSHLVDAALHDADVLAAILPNCTGVDCVRPGQYRARIERRLGMLNLHIEPELVLTRQDRGIALSIRAANRIAGSVKVDLVMALDPVPIGTRIHYEGHLQTSGLAARILAERKDDVVQHIEAMFLELKAQVESR